VTGTRGSGDGVASARSPDRSADRPLRRLHAAAQGPIDGPGLLLLPPNPLDGTAWLFQVAHLSAWFRTVAVDLPGYGHSPRLRAPTTMGELADSIADAASANGVGSAVIAGVSIGAALALHVAHRHPDRVRALILSGCSYSPEKAFAGHRIEGYRRGGLGYRRVHLRDGHAPAFRRSTLGRYLARVAVDREHLVDVESIIRLFEAYQAPEPPDLYDPGVPTLIVTGSLDYAHRGALALHERIDGSELVVLDGAGHACNMERPEAWDAAALEFLARRCGIAPGA
jgi:pimeloyl-ACP methyl ester carboxylesterase